MLGIPSSEDRRIRELLSIYARLRVVHSNHSEDYALLELLGELQAARGRLRELVDVHGASLEPLVPDFFLKQPLSVPRVIGYIVSWENPRTYNRQPTTEMLQAGRDPLTKLHNKIELIRAQMGV